MHALDILERAAPGAAPGPSPAAGQMSIRYVITLAMSAMPLRTPLPRLPPVVGARVFCEPFAVAGAAHVRIQLGYFESVRTAAEVLRVVQPHYPQATVRGVRLMPRPPSSLAVEHGTAHEGQPHHGRTARRAELAGTSGAHGFAVELLWSPTPIDLAHVPPLTLFDDHTLYAVSAHRGGHVWHGLRLGFFSDRDAAKAAMDEAASYFSGAIAVPVTDAEYAQARSAEIQPFAARVGITSIVLPSGAGG